MKSSNIPQRLQHVFNETPYWLQAGNIPGMTVAILEDGKTREVFCFGSTDLERKSPITEANVFLAASISKQALLYAALKTIEAGKLDLERPLSQYLDKPYEAADDPDIGRITARHVLTHTTGWHNWPRDGERITRWGPLGEQWTYSGQGFLFLQTALESIWNESPVDYTRRLVLDPLRMSKSSFVWRDEYEQTAISGCDQNGNASDQWRPSEVDGASSLRTTAREYALLLEAYLSPELRNRHPDVYRRQIGIDSRLGWSLGWGTADDALWQWGHHHEPSFKNFAALLPERGLGIVAMTNGARGQRICREWVNAWLETDLPAFYFKRVEL